MSMATNLFLHEEALLLALNDKTGRTVSGSWCQQALAGGVLAELIQGGRVRLVAKGKKHLVVPADRAPVGDPVIDEAARRIHESSKQRTLTDWVAKIADTRRLKHRVAEGLCQRGVLRTVNDKVLFLFPRRSYPEVDPEPEREVVERLRTAVLMDARDIGERTQALLSVAEGTGLVKRVLTKSERTRRKKRLERLVQGDVLRSATKAAVERAGAAAVVAGVGG